MLIIGDNKVLGIYPSWEYGSAISTSVPKDTDPVAVGPGRHVAGVGYIETEIKVGDNVILPTIGFTKLEHKGKDYYIGQENQILARVKKLINLEEVLEQTMEDNKEEIEKKLKIQEILNK